MRHLSIERLWSIRLEALLAAAFLALVFQLLPYLGTWLLGGLHQAFQVSVYYLDIRNYSWAAWGWLNAVLFFLLVSFRFGPEARDAWKKRSERLAAEREEAEKKRQLREQREMLERIKEGRSRRVY